MEKAIIKAIKDLKKFIKGVSKLQKTGIDLSVFIDSILESYFDTISSILDLDDLGIEILIDFIYNDEIIVLFHEKDVIRYFNSRAYEKKNKRYAYTISKVSTLVKFFQSWEDIEDIEELER